MSEKVKRILAEMSKLRKTFSNSVDIAERQAIIERLKELQKLLDKEEN